MNVSIGSKTDLGTRENNEDAVLVLEPRNGELGASAVVIVADGMGGRAFGEDASSTAVKTIRSTLLNLLAPGPNKAPYADALTAAIRRANSDVYELARAKSGNKGMGTTCVVAVIGNDGATIGHVGDSRAYLLRDGLLRRLTEDHSYVHDQVKSGQLSDHDARHSRFRHVITKAIGIDATVQPEIHSHKLLDGDSLLLCTDGLSNIVDEAGMIQIMSRARTAQEAIDYLVDAAKRGGSKDNISGALVRVGVLESDGLASSPTGEVMHGSLNAERGAPPGSGSASGEVDGGDEPIVLTRPQRTVARLRAALPLGGAAILGAAVCALALVVAGWQPPRPAVSPRHPAPSASRAIDLNSVDYGTPQVLLLQDLMPDMIAGDSGGVVVARAGSGDLVRVNAAGQVQNVGQIDTSARGLSSGSRFMAVDSLGNLYVSHFDSRMVRRYGPDGVFQRTIAENQLQRPGALWVSPVGDIFIVDDGRLKVIRAVPRDGQASGKR